MVLHIVAFAAGVLIVASTLASAVRAVVLPRAVASRITRRVFYFMRRVYRIRMARHKEYERRDRIMASYAPASLLALLATWLLLEVGGFTLIYWGLHAGSWRSSFTLSGSSLLTLGFSKRTDLPNTALSFTEAAIGLILLALLITYLPSIYGAFSRREQQVATLEVRAGYPPSAAVMLKRIHTIGWTERLSDVWRTWEAWFIDIEETHTSFPALAFFRSPQPYHSWVTATGVVLDTASIASALLDRPRDPDAELCIRAGYVALRRIADFFRLPYRANPDQGDSISVDREEFDEVCDELERAGLALKADREQAWLDFAGWRVNYDDVLIEMSALVMAPPGRWSSDRLPKLGRGMGPGEHRVVARAGRIKRLH